MKICLMTDMEGVSGVLDFPTWCFPESRYYEMGRRLLTQEANAAIDGFFAGGADEVLAVDGHGAGGIDFIHLDPRAEYSRGWHPAWPFGLDDTFDGVAWVGQHAKASTEHAHLPHTQNMQYIDLSVNGVSIGEFGQLALCAAELGVPAFFGAGDRAFTQEAEAFAPGIVTCAVKRGVMPGTGEECTEAEYARRYTGAVHIPPARACAMIRKAAEAAAWKLGKNPPPLLSLKAPFEQLSLFRPAEEGQPKRRARASHPSSVIALMNMPLAVEPIE